MRSASSDGFPARVGKPGQANLVMLPGTKVQWEEQAVLIDKSAIGHQFTARPRACGKRTISCTRYSHLYGTDSIQQSRAKAGANRQQALELAVAADKADWLLFIDADEELGVSDPKFYEKLEPGSAMRSRSIKATFATRCAT
jgi:hypothetical protein